MLEDRTLPDLLTGVLYGGLTEEVMLRWGLMSLLAVGTLRLMSGARAIWSAALIAALAFAAMHLPAVMLEAGSLTMPLIARTMLWNTVLGLLFGLAFMRGGLESAIGTHVGFHLGVAALAAALGA
ncbi:CPBP family glutamic-type intramembrane protease [Roseibacterium sp. SDUM158017]|uniref:CPBP family glutamic-type intramembrane protease n=1 Tax=Roseicyclus salinarum TaxID=3036773 RepID=UPI002414FD14|nr:CPBP family glutamic-type intramembrane protease [Roseibacterium sp. SDUM158017]MDG4650358.1 CPBP family glutamic-type intramembrane protease [Roseibacterium sp. SDUM158017]